MSVARQAVVHDVLFAQSDAELVGVAGEKLAAAIGGGSAAIVIATADHRRELTARVRAAGVDADRAVDEGALVLLDAAGTLDQLMPHGAFDAGSFDDVVGSLVRSAGERRPVQAFGEMVALLWDDGRPQEAIDLEAAWDELIRETSISLLCAYPGRLVDEVARTSELASICGLHSAAVTASPFERSWRLTDADGAASEARRAAANAMRARGAPEELFYDTLTVVTELVASAVRQAGAPVTVGLTLDSERAVVRVRDDSADPPAGHRGRAGFPSRGLEVVDALALRWGVEAVDGGKVVWAELG